MTTSCIRSMLPYVVVILSLLGLARMSAWPPVRAKAPAQEQEVMPGEARAGLSAAAWQQMLDQIEQERERSTEVQPSAPAELSDPQSGEWPVLTRIARFKVPGLFARSGFGSRVALDGDTVLIRASTNPTSIYVFERNAGGAERWGLVKQLVASEGRFGLAMALSGDTALIEGVLHPGGDPNDWRNRTGTAYVFERNAGGPGNWGEVKQLASPDPDTYQLVASALALSGDTALVGAYTDFPDRNFGAAYVFERNAGGANQWGVVKKLTAPDAQVDDGFGLSVALDGDTALVGAHAERGKGAAYLFERNAGGAGNWGMVKRLAASDGLTGDLFGTRLALDGDTAMIAAYSEPAGISGSPEVGVGVVYVFERNAGGADQWGEVRELSASDAQWRGGFGMRLAVDGDTAVVGSRYGEDPYIFRRNAGCAGNWAEVRRLGAPYDAFALDGDRVLFGAPGEDSQQPDTGAAYLFHLAPVAEGLAVEKTVAPCVAAPGQPVTYTVQFVNTGPGPASNVVIEDTLPHSLTVTSITSHTTGAGVAITQSGSAPDLAWAVSDLDVDEGGVITVTGLLDDDANLRGATLTNTVTIAGTNGLTPTEHTATAALSVPLPPLAFDPVMNEVTKLYSADAQFRRSGHAVALSGDMALVGSPERTSGSPKISTGSAYLFRRSTSADGNWVLVKKLTGSDAQVGDEFGYAWRSMGTPLWWGKSMALPTSLSAMQGGRTIGVKSRSLAHLILRRMVGLGARSRWRGIRHSSERHLHTKATLALVRSMSSSAMQAGLTSGTRCRSSPRRMS